VYGLHLHRKGVEKREVDAGEKEDVYQVGKNGRILKEMVLDHSFSAHEPFVYEEGEHENDERDHADNCARG